MSTFNFSSQPQCHPDRIDGRRNEISARMGYHQSGTPEIAQVYPSLYDCGIHYAASWPYLAKTSRLVRLWSF